MATIPWERLGIRVLQGEAPGGVKCWINWHINEVPLGSGLTGPPLLGGEYIAYMDGERVGGVFSSLREARHELERAVEAPAATGASPEV